MRPDPALLIDRGMIDREPPNNARHWLYGKGSECEHTVELPINESTVWCPLCDHLSQLRKIFVAPAVQQVWHEHVNWATGRVESDRKRMEQYGRAHAEQVSEELGIAHGFERADPGELRREAERRGGTEKADKMAEALVSTHDRAVSEGRKESRGKFVY
jgi:hypothetical protein